MGRPVGYGAAGRLSTSGRAQGSGPALGGSSPSGPRKSLMQVASNCHRTYIGEQRMKDAGGRVCAGSPASESNVCGAFLGWDPF